MNKIDAETRLSANGSNGHQRLGCACHGETPRTEAHELTDLFLAVARQLLAVDDQAAELPLRQLRVCMLLYEGPRAMSSLSRELGVSQSAMTQIADRLERARLVRRTFEGSDRRIRSLQLTPRGQKIMQLREEAARRTGRRGRRAIAAKRAQRSIGQVATVTGRLFGNER